MRDGRLRLPAPVIGTVHAQGRVVVAVYLFCVSWFICTRTREVHPIALWGLGLRSPAHVSHNPTSAFRAAYDIVRWYQSTR